MQDETVEKYDQNRVEFANLRDLLKGEPIASYLERALRQHAPALYPALYPRRYPDMGPTGRPKSSPC